MKHGFYVSPCGYHIVQVTAYRSNVHTGELLILDFKDNHLEAQGGNIAWNYSILMSCWEYLGEQMSHLCLRCERPLPPLNGCEEDDFRYVCEECEMESELSEDEADYLFGGFCE